MVKRVLLFVATNIAILVTVSIVLAVLSATGRPPERGRQPGRPHRHLRRLGHGRLARLPRAVAMDRQVVDGHQARRRATGNADLDWLFRPCPDLARQANLPMPEVGFYDSPEVNAFATGPSKKRSLVAVSTGLFRTMSQQEIEAVLAHEIAHVANGDMVTMTLIQGVVNAFVLYLSHVVAVIARSFLPATTAGRPSSPSSRATSSSSPRRSSSASSAR